MISGIHNVKLRFCGKFSTYCCSISFASVINILVRGEIQSFAETTVMNSPEMLLKRYIRV